MDVSMLQHNVAAHITSDSGESSISNILEIAKGWSDSTNNSEVSSHK